MKKSKNILIIILVLFISIVIIYNIPKLFISKVTELPEVKLKNNLKQEKTMAIMIANDNGIGYKEYESSTWPGSEYKFKEAKCMNNNGELVENDIKFKDGKVLLTTNETIYCTLYFDKPIITYLRSNDSNNNLSSTIQGDMYRYQGTKDKVDNNYICFGTNNQEECKNDQDHYMYRIIGIDENDNLKVIKETFLKEGTINDFSWNDGFKQYPDNLSETVYCLNRTCPDWNGSTLFKRLNGISNGSVKGYGYPDKANTDIFVDSEEYSYLKSGDSINGTKDNKGSTWYQLIADHEWLYGETKDFRLLGKYNAESIYKFESSQEGTWQPTIVDGKATLVEKTKWTDTIEAKIGLMYLHDLLYSYYDGNDENTRGNSGNAENLLNSWFFFINNNLNTNSYNIEWTMVGSGPGAFGDTWNDDTSSYEGYVFRDNSSFSPCIRFDGLFCHHGLVYPYGVRPVFYISENINISGTGKINSPYLINAEEI